MFPTYEEITTPAELEAAEAFRTYFHRQKIGGREVIEAKWQDDENELTISFTIENGVTTKQEALQLT